MKRIALFAFAFAGLAACETPTSAPTRLEPTVAGPSLAVTTNERVPVAFLFTNPCNGELVALEGSFHVLARSTADGAGGFHVGGQFNEHYQGVGASGAKYTAGSSNNFQFNAQPPFPFTQTQTGHLFLNRQGDGAPEDFVVKLLIHLTVNANGEMTAETFRLESECK